MAVSGPYEKVYHNFFRSHLQPWRILLSKYPISSSSRLLGSSFRPACSNRPSRPLPRARNGIGSCRPPSSWHVLSTGSSTPRLDFPRSSSGVAAETTKFPLIPRSTRLAPAWDGAPCVGWYAAFADHWLSPRKTRPRFTTVGVCSPLTGPLSRWPIPNRTQRPSAGRRINMAKAAIL